MKPKAFVPLGAMATLVITAFKRLGPDGVHSKTLSQEKKKKKSIQQIFYLTKC
jgi:hypothetical protein